eukprot:12715478-Ditylum_brightwellii.AAC.1
MLMKLQSAHGEANFKMFNKKYKCIELETFPKKANEVQQFLNYETITNDCKRNVLFIVHVTGLVSFGVFKQKIFCPLHENQVFINMTIYWSSKDTVVMIGHLTSANQKAVHCLGYQDDINDLFDKSLNKLKEEDQEEYLVTYGTNMEDAVYDIQICTGNPNVTVMGIHTEYEAMAIYARKSHAKLSCNLMEYIAPTFSDLLKSDIKFIPAHMSYDKSLPNTAAKYTDLLCEQNYTWRGMIILKSEEYTEQH